MGGGETDERHPTSVGWKAMRMVKLSLLLVFSALTSIVVAAFTVLMVLGQYYDDVFFRRTAALGVGPEGVCRAVPDGPYKIKMYFSSEKKPLTVFFCCGEYVDTANLSHFGGSNIPQGWNFGMFSSGVCVGWKTHVAEQAYAVAYTATIQKSIC